MESVPTEVTTQILSMLPARSVLRCRSVCKTWRNLIDDPGFAALHFDREIEIESHPGNNKQTRFFLCPLFYDKSDFAVYLVEQQQDTHTLNFTKMPVSLPETTPSRIFLSTTAVNGLFSMYDYGVLHGFICNPFTGQFVLLPQLLSPRVETGLVTRGFGYDKSNKVFKVVQLFAPYDKSSPTQAHVCTILGSNSSWKKLDNAPTVTCTSSAVAVGGHLHWLPNSATSILLFQLASENFGVIPVPDIKSSKHGLFLKNIDGFLCILYTECYFDIEVWVMKDYGVAESWTKFVVSRPKCKPLAFLISIQPISFWEEGEIILLCDSRILVSYDVESGRYTPLFINGLPTSRPYQVFPYCGNLLSL